MAAAERLDPEEVLKEIRIASSDKMKKRHCHCCKFCRKIGFAALTKHVAAKWKGLESVAKTLFKIMARKDKQRYSNDICEWNEVQTIRNHEVDGNALNVVTTMNMIQRSETHASDKMTLINDATLSQILHAPYSVQLQKERCHLSTNPAFDSPLSACDHLNMNTKNFILPPSCLKGDNVGGDALQPPQQEQQQS
eukprot:15324919-Ditylum_brightwellii.AAC.1